MKIESRGPSSWPLTWSSKFQNSRLIDRVGGNQLLDQESIVLGLPLLTVAIECRQGQPRTESFVVRGGAVPLRISTKDLP